MSRRSFRRLPFREDITGSPEPNRYYRSRDCEDTVFEALVDRHDRNRFTWSAFSVELGD